jgi:RHS repeat-associated protein
LNFLTAIFLTLLIFLSTGIFPAFAKVVFPQEIGGLIYEASQANTTKTYHFDQVGSTLARTDDAGKVIGRAEFSAYGLTFWKQGDMATPFLYNGQAGVQTDPNGLLNMRARYYSPYLMRFLNADPSGFSGGPNWFAYADGNPVSRADPFGLESYMFPQQYSQSSEFRGGFQQGANHGLIIGSAITVGAGVTYATGGFAGPYIAAALGEGTTASMLTAAAISGAAGGGAGKFAGNALTGQSLGDGVPSAMAFGAGLNAAGSVVGASVDAFRQGYASGSITPGAYAPSQPLLRNTNGNPIPELGVVGPHSQIGIQSGRNGSYTQAREFDAGGNPVRDIDFTNHGRPNIPGHTNPHEHPYQPNSTGGTLQRGGARCMR